MEIIFLSIGASIATEVVTKINKALQGTVIEGRGAFLLATVMALIIACVKVFYIDGTPIAFGSYQTMLPQFLAIAGGSTLFFNWIVKNLKLDVQSQS